VVKWGKLRMNADGQVEDGTSKARAGSRCGGMSVNKIVATWSSVSGWCALVE
jgi:hypothetical protein